MNVSRRWCEMMLRVGGVRDECPSQSAATVTEDRVRAHRIPESLGTCFDGPSVSPGIFWNGLMRLAGELHFWVVNARKVLRGGRGRSHFSISQAVCICLGSSIILTFSWIILNTWDNLSPHGILPSRTSIDLSSPDIREEVI